MDIFYDLGLSSVSYDRLISISTQEGNHICQQFKVDNVICPSKLRFGLITGGEIDNIDHDPQVQQLSPVSMEQVSP